MEIVILSNNVSYPCPFINPC